MTKAEFSDFEIQVGEHHMLCPLDLDAVAETYRVRNHPSVAPWFLNPGHISKPTHLRWVADYLEREDDFGFAIYENWDIAVGQCGIYNVKDGCAEFGRLMVEPTEQRKGLATGATNAAMEWAWAALGLRSIRLYVKADNVAATAVYRKCGFVETKNENGVIEMEARRPA